MFLKTWRNATIYVLKYDRDDRSQWWLLVKYTYSGSRKSWPANANIIRKSNHEEVINAPLKISNTSSKFKFVPVIVFVLEAIPLNLKPTGFFWARIIFLIYSSWIIQLHLASVVHSSEHYLNFSFRLLDS